MFLGASGGGAPLPGWGENGLRSVTKTVTTHNKKITFLSDCAHEHVNCIKFNRSYDNLETYTTVFHIQLRSVLTERIKLNDFGVSLES